MLKKGATICRAHFLLGDQKKMGPPAVLTWPIPGPDVCPAAPTAIWAPHTLELDEVSPPRGGTAGRLNFAWPISTCLSTLSQGSASPHDDDIGSEIRVASPSWTPLGFINLAPRSSISPWQSFSTPPNGAHCDTCRRWPATAGQRRKSRTWPYI